MEKQAIADLIKKVNSTILDSNKSGLLHLTAQKHTISNAIADISIKEKKTVPQIQSEIEAMIK